MNCSAHVFRVTQTHEENSIDAQKQQEARPESPTSCFFFTNSSRLFRQYFPQRPLVFTNKINGFVQQSQWIRSTKSMESLNKTNGFVSKNCQFNVINLAEKLQKTDGLMMSKLFRALVEAPLWLEDKRRGGFLLCFACLIDGLNKILGVERTNVVCFLLASSKF